LLLFTALAVNGHYETYFLNTFINHINTATDDAVYLEMQLALFWNYNSGVLLIFPVFAFLSMVDKLADSSRPSLGFAAAMKMLIKKIDISSFHKPLIDVRFQLSLYCLILSFGVFYSILGRHIGNTMTYAYQLITPFLLIYTCHVFSLPLKNLRLLKIIGNYNYVLLMPCMLLSLSLLYSSASSLKDAREWLGMEAWQDVEEILQPHENVMNSAVIVPLLMEQDKIVYDNGQTEYFQYSQYSYDWLAWFLPSNSDILRQWDEYQMSINSTLEEKGFDAVIVDSFKTGHYFESLQKNYLKTDTIRVCMFHTAQCVKLDIWEPE
jgi:hypothetical protein